MKFRIALAAATSVVAMASAASAATVSANAVANANIVAPATVTATRTLEFGTVAKPTTGSSTVTVPSAAAAAVTPTFTHSGGGNAFAPTAGQARAATFRLVGTSSQAIAVNTTALSFTNQTGNLTNVGPQTPLPSAGSLTALPANGMDDFFVGGHFDISPTTTTQAYTGTVQLSIDFN